MKRSTVAISLFIAFATAVLFVELFAAVPQLWLAVLAALIFALVVLGWENAAPVLVWLLAINILSILADILNVELAEQGLTLYAVVRNQNEAIYYSLAAMAVLALGMAIGQQILKAPRGGGQTGYSAEGPAYSAAKIALLYFAFLPVAKIADLVGGSLPGLSQPADALGLLRFALIYWLSLTVFGANRHYVWLIAVILVEIVMGSTGFFSNFKEGFFVVLIALADSKRRIPVRQLAFALAGTVVIIYMSLVWTAVKKEFRADIAGGGAVNSVTWLYSMYTNPDALDMGRAASDLLARIGYTTFYAMVLGRDTTGFGGFYERAVEHVLQPRLLFPNKAALDDSAQTNRVLHIQIDNATSVGLGYVAQAHIDFGFPGLLLPMLVIGAIVGAIYSYFLTRPAPAALCKAFGVATLFNSVKFETDIEKLFGGLLMSFLVMAITLHFSKSFLLRAAAREPTWTRAAPYQSLVSLNKQRPLR